MHTDHPLVLIVDDSPLNLAFIQQALLKNGYRTIAAYDGTSIMKLIQQDQPDIILLDVVLPDISGFEVCRRIRNTPETESIPVIFISSRSSPDEIKQGLSIGGSDYLIKPFNEIELLARIDNHYQLKKSQDKLKALNQQLLQANEIIAKKNAALETAMMQLEHLATTDSLTNLYNRRYITEKTDEEAARHKKTGHDFSFILCDIDHFKKINDEHGHQIGDYCLREAARIIQEKVRENDIVSRWGGEEFLILLPDTKREEAVAVAERIRSEINNSSIESSGLVISMTVTIGVSQYDSRCEVKDSIKIADIALYQGKERGRNRVVAL